GLAVCVVRAGGPAGTGACWGLSPPKRARRLLAGGVPPGTTTAEIARTVPEYARLLACCVDLDHSALNTLGNAVETRHWVRDRGIRSLIVVTSSYHMPRTMVEFAWQMPDVELIPFPVISEKMRNEPWWTSGSMQLLWFEYVKYLIAQVRTRIEPVSDSTDVAGDRSRTKG